MSDTQQIWVNGATSSTSFDSWPSMDMDTNIRDAKDALMKTMRNEAECLRGDLQSAQLHCQKLQRFIERRNKEVAELHRTIASLKAENGKKHNGYHPCDDIRSKLDRAVGDKKSSQNAWLELDKDYQNLEKKAADLDSRLHVAEERVLSELRVENENLKSQLEDTKSKLERSEEACIRARADTNENTAKIDLYVKEKDHFEKLYKSYKEKTEHEATQKDQTIAQLEQLRIDVGKQLEDLKANLGRVTAEKKALQNAWLELNKDYETLSKKAADLGRLMNVADKRVSDLRIENEGLKTKLQDTTTKLERSEEACIRARVGTSQNSGKIEYYIKEKDRFEELYKSYKERTERELAQKDQTIAQLGQRHDDGKQLQFIRADLERTVLENKTLRTAIDQLNERYEKLTEVKDLYEAKAEKLEKELQSRISRVEGSPTRRYIDEVSDLFRTKEDLEARLRSTEEHFGEILRDNQILQDELRQKMTNLEQSEEAYKKLRVGMQEAIDKITRYKKERDDIGQLYKSHKEKMELEVTQKDSKIVQLEKLITNLQCRLSSPKKLVPFQCCWSQEKKTAGQLTMDDLGKELDTERAKTADLQRVVRRLQQELREKRMRRSFSDDRGRTGRRD